jgi:Flp pilus assembly protein TadD
MHDGKGVREGPLRRTPVGTIRRLATITAAAIVVALAPIVNLTGARATVQVNKAPRSAISLRLGSGYYNVGISARVRALQIRLWVLGDSPGRIDGRYGRRTQLAVRRFQVAHGLHGDGVAGPRTLAILVAAIPPRRQVLPPLPYQPLRSVPPAVHRARSTSPSWALLLGLPVLGLLLGLGWYTRRRLTDRLVLAGELSTNPDEPPIVEDADTEFSLGVALEHVTDPARAEAAYRRADARGHAAAASNLGVLLEERGELAGAEAAYRRADERGDPNGAYNLGVLLEERSDLVGAEAAYRRADARGHAAAASNLGVLLEERGELAGAEAAYRCADERGDPNGAYNLGVLLEERGDLAEAEAAYRRAGERGNAHVAKTARTALLDLGPRVSPRAPLDTLASISRGPSQAANGGPTSSGCDDRDPTSWS